MHSESNLTFVEEESSEEQSFSSTSSYNEEKLIEDVTTTPYEKVLKILSKFKAFMSGLEIFLNNNKIPSESLQIGEMTQDLEWVVTRIQSHTLYNYDLEDDEHILRLKQENPEMMGFLDMISDFTETKEIKSRNKTYTMKMDKNEVSGFKKNVLNSFAEREKNKDENEINRFLKTVNSIRKKSIRKVRDSPSMRPKPLQLRKVNEDNLEECVINLKNIDTKSNSCAEFESVITLKGPGAVSHPNSDTNISTTVSSEFTDTTSNNNNLSMLIDSVYDNKKILSQDFDIHEFDRQIGRANLFILIARTIFDTFCLYQSINESRCNSFFESISKGYMENVFYHNSLHGADVAQTVATYLMNSNLEEITQLTNLDIVAFISAALAHDIGHPGTNNGFQVNTNSEIAVTYNDQSVLENYHSTLFFKIVKKQENNIFDILSESEYKNIRKRIIKCILSTDMVLHAKIVSLVKGKVMAYKEIKSGSMVSGETIFDDQQIILDFVLHSADFSHNTKSFKISQKWTELLMEEFWKQGDTEKSLSIPVSFLCDRQTAEVPKSQIGFIKGIIVPTFDVLVDLLPELKYIKDNIDKNLEEWTKLAGENKTDHSKSPKFLSSPAISQLQQRRKSQNFFNPPLFKFASESTIPTQPKKSRLMVPKMI